MERKNKNQRQLLHSAMYLIRSILKDDYVLKADPKVIKLMLEDANLDVMKLNVRRIESKVW
jgi:hypothetical protein